MQKPIYLDYASTTPCDPEVVNSMMPYFSQIYGNINSLHYYGAEALEAVCNAREQIANDINCETNCIVFTSGATESSNIAILRTLDKLNWPLLTAKTQHASIISITEKLQRQKHKIVFLPVDNDGLLDLNFLEDQVKLQTCLVSICLVNNETGTVQPLDTIHDICHKHGSLLHVDAAQAYGKIQFNAEHTDFFSASGHKFYGPKGIGLLFCKKEQQKYIRVPRSNPDVEFGIRAGTIPVPLCVGIAIASKLAHLSIDDELSKMNDLRKQFIDGIKRELTEIYINGSQEYNYPGIVNISFRGCEGEALMMEAKKIAISSGSACTSNKLTISHVLNAMNVEPDIAQSSLRISFGKYTTKQDVNIAIEELVNATNKLRPLSAIWDMIQSGINISKAFNTGIYKRQ